jgi:hypothetical protein
VYFFGGIYENFILLLIGRIVFGIGGESLSVVSSILVYKWFKNDKLSFFMGVLNTISM